MIRRPPRSTQSRSSAASDVYKRQLRKRHGKKLINKLAAVIPEKALKQVALEYWEEAILKSWVKITEEFDAARAENGITEEELTARLYWRVIGLVKGMDIYGAALIPVQTSKRTKTELSRVFPEAFLLGVRHDYLLFVDLESKTHIEKYKYSAITQAACLPGILIITILGFSYHFETSAAFEALSLINLFRDYNKLEQGQGMAVV
eukprot:TRINITY_DN7651_c0_g1_i2.p1 TRINITY_DN7651_c0_g1~~TRINITY_DN7651_c0_g1_i2.p1  ORF type:complete len:205 (-),score=45.87 TRINITY_DN7651_c0_g1_i2:28-642(-)